MIKKDFELIANTIAKFDPVNRDRLNIAIDFAIVFGTLYPRFDVLGFIKTATKEAGE